MFSKEKLEKYAEVMLWGLETARNGCGGRLRPYDVVLLSYDPAGLPLAEAVNRRLLKRKLNVIARSKTSPVFEKDFYTHADKKQLSFLDKGTLALGPTLNGLIRILAPTSLTHLKGVDPGKFGVSARARKPFREMLDRREEAGKFSWTLCLYPTEEPARQARTDLRRFTAQIEKACFLDRSDPVKEWKRIFKESSEIKKRLNSLPIETLTLGSKSMDLRVTLGEKRRFVGVSGHNIPSFEIFTSPDCRGTEGVYYSDLPTFRTGNLVKEVRLVFRKGRAVKVDAAQGADYVRKVLKTDPGACRLGEFSLTDKRFSRIDRFMADTLFDENYGGRFGNCHLAVGSCYTETFTGNPKKLTKAAKKRLGFNDSSVHWDLVNTEDKLVSAKLRGGKSVVLYESGRFKL